MNNYKVRPILCLPATAKWWMKELVMDEEWRSSSKVTDEKVGHGTRMMDETMDEDKFWQGLLTRWQVLFGLENERQSACFLINRKIDLTRITNRFFYVRKVNFFIWFFFFNKQNKKTLFLPICKLYNLFNVSERINQN